MISVIIILLFLTHQLTFSYDFKLTIRYDEMLLAGELLPVIQYHHDGKIEAILGNLNRNSTDGNVKVNRTLTGNSYEFIINNSRNFVFDIWLINDLATEEFVSEEDYYALSKANIKIFVEDKVNGKTFITELDENQQGLVIKAGSIIDGKYFELKESFLKKRLYVVKIIDALNGEPLEDVNIIIKNKRTNETVSMGKTDNNGFYMTSVEYGQYEAVLFKKSYLEKKYEFEMNILELPVSSHIALTPEIMEFRIILTWGKYPFDLDAHLMGPKPDGSIFHIWWRNKILIDGKNFLDRDDQDSYGPETITIYKHAKGNYYYAVHNYSDRNQSNGAGLSYSSAHVDVYANKKLVASFDVPLDKRGNVWKVFTINEDNELIPINQFYDRAESSKVFE